MRGFICCYSSPKIFPVDSSRLVELELWNMRTYICVGVIWAYPSETKEFVKFTFTNICASSYKDSPSLEAFSLNLPYVCNIKINVKHWMPSHWNGMLWNEFLRHFKFTFCNKLVFNNWLQDVQQWQGQQRNGNLPKGVVGHVKTRLNTFQTGLPDGLFSNPKSQFR
jgi:hypothetical protein